MSGAPQMKRAAIACAPILRSCTPVACENTRSIPRKPILCCPRPAVSFAAALTKRSWMNCLPSKPLRPCRKGWSVRRISSSIPFRVNKGANASRMRPRCIKHKKNARAHRRHHAAVPLPRHRPHVSGPSASPRAEKSHAWLWSKLSRPRSRLREARAPHRTATPGTGGA